ISANPDHRIPREGSLSLESQRTNTHPTDAAVASLIRPSLSMPKSSLPQSQESPYSTSIPAAMIPQNHPLDSLKTQNYIPPLHLSEFISSLSSSEECPLTRREHVPCCTSPLWCSLVFQRV